MFTRSKKLAKALIEFSYISNKKEKKINLGLSKGCIKVHELYARVPKGKNKKMGKSSKPLPLLDFHKYAN